MRSALPAALFAVLLVTAGCTGVFGPSRPPSDERAVDAVDRSLAATADLESYRFTLDGRLEGTRDGRDVVVDFAGHGAVNVTDQRLNASIRADDETRSTYLTGYTAYTECSRIGWGREDLSQSAAWIEYTPLGEHLALLNRTDVYWRGTETFDGTEAAVVSASPTEGELQAGPDGQASETTDVGDANLENVTVTAWIDTDTDRPLGVRWTIEFADATVTMTFRYTDYDEPTTVSRPAFDAEDAWSNGCPGD